MEKSHIYTAKELSDILSKAQTDALKNKVIMPPSFEEIIAADIQAGGAPPIAAMMYQFGGIDSITSMMGYWEIRDQVQQYQQLHGVSGLINYQVKLGDRTVEFLDWDEQLILQEFDLPILQAQSPRLVAEFFEVTAGYSFLIEHEDESKSPITEVAIRKHGRSATHCWISGHSYIWKQVEDGWQGGWTHKHEEDEICLSIYLGRVDDDAADRVRIIAEHPDITRRPWLNELK